jgi:hypothetical protein
VAVLRMREPTKAVNEAGVTESGEAFSVRRPQPSLCWAL